MIKASACGKRNIRGLGLPGWPLGVTVPTSTKPNPKTGTVTTDVAKAVTDIKGGKIEFRIDKNANLHFVIGKVSFTAEQLAENIIHTFKFYYTDTDTIEELKHEVITFLLEKLHLYNPTKGKAFSYFGTIAKRYLIVYNENNYKKLQEKADVDESDDEQMLLYENDKNIENAFDELSFMDQYIKYIDTHIYRLFPKKQDAQTADAIVELFRKRETLEIFNKKALYIYIREITDVSTPQITKIIKKLKTIYVQLYNEYYQHGYIKI